MRINRYIASRSNYSRRQTDDLIKEGLVLVNNIVASIGQEIEPESDTVIVEGRTIDKEFKSILLAMNKPVGYVCSRKGQGNKTVYELLPEEYKELNTIGRLDKKTSGLLLMTNDGLIAQELAHPSNSKEKVYEVKLNIAVTEESIEKLKAGVELDDGISKINVLENSGPYLKISLEEGRNRQIRRTMEALGLKVRKLHRIAFGAYELSNLKSGEVKELSYIRNS